MKSIRLRVFPEILHHPEEFTRELSKKSGIPKDLLAYRIMRKSIDARRWPVYYEVECAVWNRDNERPEEEYFDPGYTDVHSSVKTCHIIGAGPAGYFAALECLKQGIKPVIIERGKDVRARRFDLAAIFKKRVIHPHSNYCFGEGGAGTYSDGKLYTRSHKRGNILEVLKTLVYHGAGSEILVDSHPHIGTNRLPAVIENIRKTLLQHGGEIHFNTFMSDFILDGDRMVALELTDSAGAIFRMPCSNVILSTGHSGREVYEMLHRKNIRIEIKPFALGVRIEHPQELIDCMQYHCMPSERNRMRQFLPAASYALKAQVKGRGVYSFCMCPGGIIAPCATGAEEVVTNGWSPNKRNNPFANSGIVVEVLPEDWAAYSKHGPLAALEFQRSMEHRAWLMGGKNLSAPAARLTDFLNGKISSTLPECSYKPGIVSADLNEVLGKNISDCLREGLSIIGKKAKPYITEEAVLVGVESRTSSPVRIPRTEKGNHPQILNLFPCGEGAGYAGGIVSAALDGIRAVKSIILQD